MDMRYQWSRKIGFTLLALGFLFMIPNPAAGQIGMKKCEVCTGVGVCASLVLPGHEACVQQGYWCSEEGDECSPLQALRDTSPEGGFQIPDSPSAQTDLTLFRDVDIRGVIAFRTCSGAIVAREYPKTEEARLRNSTSRITI